MVERVPLRYVIQVSPAFFKSVFEDKINHYSYIAPSSENSKITDVEKNPRNIANVLKELRNGDSLVFEYDPSTLDHVDFMGDAKNVCELERVVTSIKRFAGPAGRDIVAAYFK